MASSFEPFENSLAKPDLSLNQVSGTILRQSDSIVAKILLFGDNKLDFETNKILPMSTIEFI